LLPVVILLAIGLFFAALRYFRRDPAARQFVEETLGDDTPRAALEHFYEARERLERVRARLSSKDELTAEIDSALGQNTRPETVTHA